MKGTAVAATLHVLRPQTPPFAGFLRLGHTGHRKLAEFQAAGRFPYKRVVVDAAHFLEQRDLVKILKAAGCEIVLDPNVAEMATSRFESSSLQRLPWSNSDRPWEPGDFGPHRNHDAARAIALFAIAADVHAVLAPTHLIEPGQQSWRPVDLKLCEALRRELDQAGGLEIEIDYQLITTSALLKDTHLRDGLAADIAGLPVTNIWLRDCDRCGHAHFCRKRAAASCNQTPANCRHGRRLRRARDYGGWRSIRH